MQHFYVWEMRYLSFVSSSGPRFAHIRLRKLFPLVKYVSSDLTHSAKELCSVVAACTLLASLAKTLLEFEIEILFKENGIEKYGVENSEGKESLPAVAWIVFFFCHSSFRLTSANEKFHFILLSAMWVSVVGFVFPKYFTCSTYMGWTDGNARCHSFYVKWMIWDTHRRSVYTYMRE